MQGMRIVVADAGSAPPPDADVLLLPGRAAYLPASGTLLVADLHLGKAATFRRAGIPVPEGSTQADLARLERLVNAINARRLLILGDLFHARSGCTDRVFAEFAALRQRIAATETILVLGNHDRGIGALPATLGLDGCLPALMEPPFHFVHEPTTALAPAERGRCTVAGHLHPTVAIRGPGGDTIADRCFAADEQLLILPAFGSFTGGQRMDGTAGWRLWIARDDGVAEVTRLAARATRSRG